MSQNPLAPKPLPVEPHGHYTTQDALEFLGLNASPAEGGKYTMTLRLRLQGEVLLDIPLTPLALAGLMQVAGPLLQPR